MKPHDMTICLWYNDQAEEAANYYASIFPNVEIGQITRFGTEGFEHHGKQEGTVMTVSFTLNRMNFIALNGGPQFGFTEAVSFVVNCETQEEIDYYWTSLSKDGEEQPCGWLKDKFGVSWQIVPSVLGELMNHKDAAKAKRVMQAMFRMKKLDIGVLQQACDDESAQ